MNEILFKAKIPGRPRVKKNGTQQKYSFKHKRTFTAPSERYLAWARYAKLFIARVAPHVPIDFPVNLTMRFYFKDHAHEQDCSNSMQGIEDLLEECGVLQNDKLIYSVNGTRKIFDSAEDERVEIELTRHEFLTEVQAAEYTAFAGQRRKRERASGKRVKPKI